ncbi:retrovirus-related pol polyprotein from transposon TNT 1-94 [Tanacetum coccineum]|uniref:Retrovirus-related pol polyprotein from transposon TNT 1-94 n=1 Tax=Tanacetum coccineum TaxID=301880 RepID=A0ABQ4WMV2_9ASTR
MNHSVATPLRRTVASESTNQKSRSTIRKLYEHVSKTCSWWYPKFTPSGYKWKPKSPIGNVNTNVSMPLGNESRTADILEPMTPRCSTQSNTPLSFNSFAARRDIFIHRRLWVLKAHDGKSQASKQTPEVLIDFLKLVQRGLHAQAKAIATACFTQNCSLVIPRHEKTPYHIINDRKPSVKFLQIFGSLCYIVRYGENLDKMKEQGDACIFVGYSTQSRAYRVYNKRTRVIVETIHVNFDELPQMASDHVSSDPTPQSETVTTSNKLDLLFSLMFDELLNGTTQVVPKSSAVTTADAPNQHQQQHTTPSTSTNVAADTPPLNIQTTPETTSQAPTQGPTVTNNENIIQA